MRLEFLLGLVYSRLEFGRLSKTLGRQPVQMLMLTSVTNVTWPSVSLVCSLKNMRQEMRGGLFGKEKYNGLVEPCSFSNQMTDWIRFQQSVPQVEKFKIIIIIINGRVKFSRGCHLRAVSEASDSTTLCRLIA